MKSFLVLLFALFAFAAALPRPAEKSSEEVDKSDDAEEIYVVPLEKSSPRRPFFGFGISDDLVPPPFQQNPFFRSGPWGGASRPTAGDGEVDDFMTQMQEMMTEMRRQLTDLLHHAHTGGHLPGTDDNGTGVVTRIGDDGELPKNKSTSTTKVIDGHVVTVNETTYSSGDDNIGAVFRIKVVEVKPSETPEGEEDIEGEVTPDIDNKTSNNPTPKIEREPTTSKTEIDEDKHEETNEIPNSKVFQEWEWSPEFNPSLNEIDESEESPVEKEKYYDLSDDTKVNDYVSQHAQSQGLVMIEPDAELIDTNSRYHYSRIPQRLENIQYEIV